MSTKRIIRRVLTDDRSANAFIHFVATVATAALEDEEQTAESAPLERTDGALPENTKGSRGAS